MSFQAFASCGNTVKVWSTSKESREFSPFDSNDRISSISWSPNGKYILSCSSKGNKIAVTDVDQPTRKINLTPTEENTYVSFSKTANLNFLSCGQDGSVSIWNLHSRTISKSLNTSTDKSYVVCAAYDPRDSYVACGMKSGAVVIISTTTSVAHKPLIYPNMTAITDIKFSPKQKNLFGTSSDDGGCNIFDCYKRTRVHSFEDGHEAPATGFCFSPLNELLLATSGLDKYVKFYDFRSRKTIFTTKTKDPLNCLDFTSDGKFIAVGSTRGSIFMYDLRSTTTPLDTMLNAHTGGIKAVLFQNVSNLGDDAVLHAVMREYSGSNNVNINNNSLVPGGKWQVPLHTNETSRLTQSTSHSAYNYSFSMSKHLLPVSKLDKLSSNVLSTTSLPPNYPLPTTSSSFATQPSISNLTTNEGSDEILVEVQSPTKSISTETSVVEVEKVNKQPCPELTSRLREIVSEELTEFKKEMKLEIFEMLNRIHLNMIREFVNQETMLEECYKKLLESNNKLDKLEEQVDALKKLNNL